MKERNNTWDMKSGFAVLPGHKCFLYYNAQLPTLVQSIGIGDAHCWIIHQITIGVNSQFRGDPVPGMVLSGQTLKLDRLTPGMQFAMEVENVSDTERTFEATANVKEVVF